MTALQFACGRQTEIGSSILMLPYCCCVLVHRRRKQNFKIYFSQNAYHEFMTRTREGDASVNPLIAVEPAQTLKRHLVV